MKTLTTKPGSPAHVQSEASFPGPSVSAVRRLAPHQRAAQQRLSRWGCARPCPESISCCLQGICNAVYHEFHGSLNIPMHCANKFRSGWAQVGRAWQLVCRCCCFFMCPFRFCFRLSKGPSKQSWDICRYSPVKLHATLVVALPFEGSPRLNIKCKY